VRNPHFVDAESACTHDVERTLFSCITDKDSVAHVVNASSAMRARGRQNPFALLMAVLAVLALGATVFIAQLALSDARDVVVRGEGDVLLSAVASELVEEGGPPSAATLERSLAAHQAQGMRYVGVVDREGHAIAEAGSAEMHGPLPRPGQSNVLGKRMRVAGPLMPPHRPRMHLPNDGGAPLAREHHAPPFGLAFLVVELEPPVMETLRGHLTRISIVAALAGGVLLAFAIAWSRSAGRLAAIEEKAAREQRLVALGSMSSVMAHELRNPLASLKGTAQLLVEDFEDANDSKDAKKKKKAERVVAEAERLEVLTTSLLDFVRDGPIERISVTPKELVDSALDGLTTARVKVDVERAPSELFVDRSRLARAIHNLVDNALQAQAEGDVSLTLEKKDDGAAIEVRDRGEGIPAGQEAQIFEPFVTTRTKGTGLGLAVARRIAEQHEGTLTGENHPDGGALFRLTLPTTR